MRLGLILGLNHNIPERQCINPIEREHRVRIWWAVYIFDRMWGSKTGFPLQIRDEDIHVDMPTELQLNTAVAAEQFSDTAYLVASVQLARIVGQIVEKIYSRKEQGGGRSCRGSNGCYLRCRVGCGSCRCIFGYHCRVVRDSRRSILFRFICSLIRLVDSLTYSILAKKSSA